MTTNMGYELAPGDTGWEPFEAGEVKWLRSDGATQSGIWRCTTAQQPGVHEAAFAADETVHILRGRVRVEIVGGPVLELGPGHSASFVKGTVGRWTVLEDVEEFFVYH